MDDCVFVFFFSHVAIFIFHLRSNRNGKFNSGIPEIKVATVGGFINFQLDVLKYIAQEFLSHF